MAAVNDQGALANPSFLDTVLRLRPFYWLRLAGGLMYLVGVLMMIWNLLRTVYGPRRALEPAPAVRPAS